MPLTELGLLAFHFGCLDGLNLDIVVTPILPTTQA